MTKLLLVAGGGAVGALLRYLVSGMAYQALGESFPWGTLTVNVLGSFAIGLLWAISEEVALPAAFSPFVFVGMIGAFTTFSTYGLETFNLLRDGEVRLGLLNFVGSNLLGFVAVVLGFFGARYLMDLFR